MAMMEGTLWKWTNYLSGWQPRWFVLEVGVLAYYKSQEEVGLGSRGSIKMACCEISVHPTDSVRIELKIPPDQHIYLRAATPAERQQWLVALGTAKACITQAHSATHEGAAGHSMHHLKTKMEEMSMYRSLLLQEINTIKLLCTSKEDTQEFSEAATMLSATCDEFLKNMCDCIEIAENNFGAITSSPSSPTSPTSIPTNKGLTAAKHSSLRKNLLHERHRSTSPPPSPSSSIASSLSSSLNSQPTGQTDRPVKSVHFSDELPAQQPTQTSAHSTQPNPSTVDRSARHNGEAAGIAQQPTEHKRPTALASSRHSSDAFSPQLEDLRELKTWTFFSSAKHKFEDIQITAEGGIPTKSFLLACAGILPFFDVLGSTAFAPVKMDISGNITKISNKYETDVKAFVVLQNIVYQELKSNTCTAKNSATDALLWLKRALEFMHVFLAEVLKGEPDLAVAAGTAYGKSLRRYHGWVVRGVFALAVKAVPYREDLLTSLGTTNKGVASHEHVLTDMKCCVDGLGRVIGLLNQFYRKHKLDSDSTV